jgi:3-oxoacyl-[acyl-carrier protein] reductase
VAPGFIETDLTAGLSSQARARAVEATVVGRGGRAEEVAHAVAFLCDEGAAYVTGTVLHVNGGMYM